MGLVLKTSWPVGKEGLRSDNRCLPVVSTYPALGWLDTALRECTALNYVYDKVQRAGAFAQAGSLSNLGWEES